MNTESPAVTSTSASAALRPRNRRLISYDNENVSVSHVKPEDISGREATSSLSSFSSKAVSPIPSRHPSHSAQPSRADQRQHSNTGTFPHPSVVGTHITPSNSAGGLWGSSWSSLQGIAFNLLSGETLGSSSRNLSPRQKRRPLEATQALKRTGPTHWGPSENGGKQLGRGSREDRLAQVQAKKREALLAPNGFLTPNVFGRYKRRDSEERGTTLTSPMDHGERDALVYIHKVKPNDTLAGVMIKYNCQPNSFRKANRLWPNDSIQVKRTVVLPVEACGVKGRKMPEPSSFSRPLKSMNSQEAMGTPKNTYCPWDSSAGSSETQENSLASMPTSPSISVTSPEESPWKHDSWVMIDGFAEAVEIARLPIRTLGFFPPNRRKSRSFSDFDTPSASLDLFRDNFPDRSPQRKESRSSSSSHFVHQLQGPGGVGTLGKDVRNPGPAQDGLNKLFTSHLPSVAPRTSFESTTSTSSTGIEHVGGAIEGWVRKFANKAAARVQSPAPKDRSGIGDLIELTDSFELEEDADESSRGRDGERPSAEPAAGTWPDEQERMLKEHFPPRGRMFGDSTRRKGI